MKTVDELLKEVGDNMHTCNSGFTPLVNHDWKYCPWCGETLQSGDMKWLR